MILRETEDIYEVVKKTFKGDNPYLQKYHVESPCGLYEAVAYTVNHILVYTPNQAVFYEIMDGSEPVGYACIIDNEIWDFAIHADHRKEKDKIWDCIVKGMQGYSVRLYQDNERDLLWLTKERGCKPTYHYMPTSEIVIKSDQKI
jgi:hypothetical protein